MRSRRKHVCPNVPMTAIRFIAILKIVNTHLDGRFSDSLRADAAHRLLAGCAISALRASLRSVALRNASADAVRAQSACLCPKILKYTKYSVPAAGGMPAIVLAGKLTTP